VPVAVVSPASSVKEFAPNIQPLLKKMKKTILLTLVIAGALCSAFAGDAKENYDKGCAKCHGKEGKGDTKMGQKLGIKDYTDAKVQAEMKDDAACKAIKEGLKDKEGKTLMKPSEDLSDADIKALVAHMRSFKK
jgi:cytochrome c553